MRVHQGLIVLLERLRRPPWLQKAIRTGLAVAPGLAWWAATGDALGVTFSFASLCLSVAYGDASFTGRHLAIMAVLAALLLPGATWIEARPFVCVPVIMAAMVVVVLVRRRTEVPDRMTNWLLIFLLYQASELSGEGIAASLRPAALIPPAAVWTWIVCFLLWPGRGVEPARTSKSAQPAAAAVMSVPRHAICAALATGAAASAAFLLHLSHVNWAIWSAITVVQSGAGASLVKSIKRVIGGAFGCALGILLLTVLHAVPWLLAAVTAVLVFLMVAPEFYTLAVAIRSALAVLAGAALDGNGAAAGLARIENIAIGVALALLFVTLLTPRPAPADPSSPRPPGPATIPASHRRPRFRRSNARERARARNG